MTNARDAGKHWTDIAGRDRGLANALLVTLLLMLSLLAGQAGAGPDEWRSGAGNSEAADMLGAESKAQLVGRPWLLGAEQQRAKPKLSGDGLGVEALAPSASLLPGAADASASAGTPDDTPASSRTLAARPRAPPPAA